MSNQFDLTSATFIIRPTTWLLYYYSTTTTLFWNFETTYYLFLLKTMTTLVPTFHVYWVFHNGAVLRVTKYIALTAPVYKIWRQSSSDPYRVRTRRRRKFSERERYLSYTPSPFSHLKLRNFSIVSLRSSDILFETISNNTVQTILSQICLWINFLLFTNNGFYLFNLERF